MYTITCAPANIWRLDAQCMSVGGSCGGAVLNRTHRLHCYMCERNPQLLAAPLAPASRTLSRRGRKGWHVAKPTSARRGNGPGRRRRRDGPPTRATGGGAHCRGPRRRPQQVHRVFCNRGELHNATALAQCCHVRRWPREPPRDARHPMMNALLLFRLLFAGLAEELSVSGERGSRPQGD
jgi:hypothetical protein